MKNMQTPSHRFIAVRLETTGRLDRNLTSQLSNIPKVFSSHLLLVVKKFNMVVTPRVTLAGSAFHSIQNVTKLLVTRIIPKI